MSQRAFDRIALGIAAASLLALGLRPSSTVWRATGVAVVRSPGASAAETQRLADSLRSAVIDLHDLAALRRAGVLHVIGWGLDAGELRSAGDRTLFFHPTSLPDGIRSASWPSSLALGEEMVVTLDVASRRREMVVLATANGTVDSVGIPGGTTASSIMLTHRPAAIGATQYIVRTGGVADTFSVLITTAVAPTTLILGAAPSRGWSDLRDWVARQGGSVTVRTPVSRDRTRLERLNSGPSASEPVTATGLAPVGVIVSDGRGLLALTATERRLVRNAVEGGAGLILTLDDEARDPRRWTEEERRVFLPWSVVATEGLDERQVRPRSAGRPLGSMPVEAEGAVLGPLPFGSTPLLDDGQGGVIAALTATGRGRVVGTLVTGMGRWLRGGEAVAFGGYWQRLIRAAARPDPRAEWMNVGPGPVMVDRALTITRPLTRGSVATVGGDTIRFTPDPLAPDHGVARWWPRAAGWNEMDGVRVWVADSGAWRTWRAAERTRHTAESRGRAPATGRSVTEAPVRRPWPLWPFFLLFVLSSGWCWRKVSPGP